MHPSAHLSPDPASLTESLSQQDRAADPVKPEDNADTSRQAMQTQQESVDHLAIEEARGENCNRIRELMAPQRANAAFQHPLTDDEREAAIKRAGNAVVRFKAEGKHAEARTALSLMHRLIESRSEAWKAARTAQIDAAIYRDSGAGFLIDQGNADRAALASNEGRGR